MNKISIITATLLFYCSVLYSQVSISADASAPDNSAMLDVKSTDRGILIPRMSTSQRNSIAFPAEGLLVYDINLGGYYYYHAGSWTSISSAAGGWSLTGNAGTNPALNFIGTTDNIALKFKVNNQLSGLLDPTSLANTGFGYRSLTGNTTGTGNTAIGFEALKSNSSGFGNAANGYRSLYSNSTGYYNTSIGSSALFSNTTGYYNTASGYQALYSDTTGTYNSSYGFQALVSNTSGHRNTAIGASALQYNTMGTDNTALGVYAGPNAGAYSNCTALGYNATVDASNKVVIGNTIVTSIGGYTGWSNFSDGRYKKNVSDNVPGLAFISQLRPVTYNLDVYTLNDELERTKPALMSEREKPREETPEEHESADLKSRIFYTGFIAQEVETAAKSIGYDFSGVDAPQNPEGHYGLRYAEFVVPLVKAVQEQQEIIKNQQQQIDELIERVEALEKK